jgi:hypothetical protein
LFCFEFLEVIFYGNGDVFAVEDKIKRNSDVALRNCGGVGLVRQA